MSEEQNFEQTGQTEEGTDVQQTDQNAGGDPNGTNENDDDRKLFVGGLSWETKEEDLRDYMATFGKVSSCNLKKDMETHRSRGFGFVVYESSDSIEKVLAEKEHKLHGKTIDPKRANPKGNQVPLKKIYVAKVATTVTEESIKEYFSQWGKVEKVEAPFDKEKEQRKNFVFVEFDSEETVDKVLNHTTENPEYKHTLGGEEVEIKKATQPSRGRGRGGFFRGGDRGRGRGGYGNYGGWNDYSQAYYPGYGNGYGGYSGYGGYGGANYGYDNSYYQGYGAGWGGYDQGYGYGGYGGYDYSGGWGGYGDQSGQQMSGGYGKAPNNKRGGGNSGFRPY